MNNMRIGATAGIVAPIIAFSCILLAITSYAPFSWTHNALSDLGVVWGMTSLIFNGGVIAAGISGLIFAVLGLYRFVGQSQVGKLGSAVFGAAMIALTCIGIFNESFVPIHYFVSVAFFVLAPIALFILTTSFAHKNQWDLAIFTVGIAVAAALPWIFQFAINYVPKVAIPEAVSALVVSIWAIVLATKMLGVKTA